MRLTPDPPGLRQLPDAAFLVEQAPSGGNARPWRFILDGPCIGCYIDEPRSLNVLNVRGRTDGKSLATHVVEMHVTGDCKFARQR